MYSCCMFVKWCWICSVSNSVKKKFVTCVCQLCFLAFTKFVSLRRLGYTILIPKLLLRLLWFFRRTAALFRQIRTFPQLFRFCSDLGNPGIRQIVRDSVLTGRWWEGRILINLCGKNNVRNCDLLQSAFCLMAAEKADNPNGITD